MSEKRQDTERRRRARRAPRQAHGAQEGGGRREHRRGAGRARAYWLSIPANGKGKSSAAFGVVARALGHGMKVAVIQFIKGRSDTGEEDFLPAVSPRRCPVALNGTFTGEGFTWDTQNLARDMAVAEKAWDIARQLPRRPGLRTRRARTNSPTSSSTAGSTWTACSKTLAMRPPMQHVIITGRAAPDALVEAADNGEPTWTMVKTRLQGPASRRCPVSSGSPMTTAKLSCPGALRPPRPASGQGKDDRRRGARALAHAGSGARSESSSAGRTFPRPADPRHRQRRAVPETSTCGCAARTTSPGGSPKQRATQT